MKFSIILFISILIYTGSAIAEPTIIVNESMPVNELSKNDVKQIFIGKKRNWENGDSIIPVILKAGETHKTFLMKFLHKSEAQFKTYWKKLVFTGRGQAPQEFKTESELVEYVAKTKGAIGYIDSASLQEGVKQISIK